MGDPQRPGAVRRGYVVRREGVLVGLDAANAKPFVNTSFHMLNGFDYLYDADGGFAGFRARQGR
ncbi:MAG: hypothetical protein B7X99_15780 [Rhizobiales bacterium 17-65-6]|nr:MAG: hypothetical protein B7X99_15780 [Rhizobiales bacterium 17-65-6]